MDTETAAALKQIDDKIEVVYASVERTRKYMLWSLIMQVAVVLLPLVVLMFAAPFLLASLSSLSGLYQGL